MFAKQALVLMGMIAAVVVLLLVWTRLPLLPLALPVGDDAASRIAFVARWLLLPGLALFAGVVGLASRRFFVTDAMDGTRAPESRSLEINLRYNQNTLEQVVLAAIAWSGLALQLPHDRLSLIPALAILFLIARAIFWVGYLIAPWARALGFGLTFYPTAIAIVWLASRMLA
jgi:hypothetical protein